MGNGGDDTTMEGDAPGGAGGPGGWGGRGMSESNDGKNVAVTGEGPPVWRRVMARKSELLTYRCDGSH